MNLLNLINIYRLITLLLLLLYFLGILIFGIEKIIWQALPAILSTTLAGALFDYLELKRFSYPITPFISGLIIGLVAQFGADAIVLVVIGFLAMAAKFFIKWDGRHIFNPAASGLFLGMILFSSYPAWWGGSGYFWIFFIWIPILLIKFKRWAPMVGFLIPVIIKDGGLILTSGSLLFFLSVMLIEPKTSPADVKIGLIYGIIVGIGYLIFSQTTFDPLISSLLIGNLGGRLLGKFLV
ncbi:hypothetical protein HYS94_03665 [Candidatus Daviesbacteria bacterium]|nr:hypothetical protein [Candidatus Daviesbacteria bacterium]